MREITWWEVERERKRESDNLDEEEQLAEAGQQRQKASQDTVIHVPELFRNTVMTQHRTEERVDGKQNDTTGL